ncbi:MAG: hypothetical protein II782_02890 [Oscillospiraceae bacterium]|nr:hypothetical protein [Oscillospiraceae bacterium]
MTFDDMPFMMMSLQCFYALFLIFALFCVIAASIRMRRGYVSYIITSLLILISYGLYQIFNRFMLIKRGTVSTIYAISTLHALPEWVWLGILTVMTILTILMAIDVVYYGAGKLSSHSVKFATDDLPAGLCIYDKSGRILLMNETMAKIGTDLTGEYVLSGKQILSRVDTAGSTPLRLSDGSVFTFSLEQTAVGSTELTEITAENITEEYDLTEKLHKIDEELIDQQQRLRELNVLITEMTIQKEILAAKTSVHDRFGSTIIATKRFIRGDSENTREELTAIWNKTLDLLQTSGESEQKDIYEKVFTVAGYVGVDIEIKGELPKEKERAEIIVTALIECLTNTFRHAHGDRILLECINSAKTDTYILTNNGEAPKTEINETGGLKNLRQAAENLGWKMEIQSIPAFMLTLIAPEHRGDGNL